MHQKEDAGSNQNAQHMVTKVKWLYIYVTALKWRIHFRSFETAVSHLELNNGMD